MTFIIALGAIIILLCSASVFKLIQPSEPKKPNTKRTKQNRYKKEQQKQETKVPVAAKPIKAAKPKKIKQAVSAESKASVKAKAEFEEQLSPKPSADAVVLPEMIALNMYSDPDKPYCGYELLQALLSVGMRFGKMSVFHRHEKKTGVGRILFSLAACTKDGIFDLAKIGGFSCKGLILYMNPKAVDDPVKVFELMLEVADQLVSDLGGKVLNERQELLKKDHVIHTHQMLQKYMTDRASLGLFTES